MLLTARYVIPVSGHHIEYGAVLVRGDEIVEVGDFESLRASYPDEPVRDFGLAALMPGFVDLHTHLEYSAMRGVADDLPYARWKLQVMELEPRLNEQDWRDSALLGALEAMQSGITTVADVTTSGAGVGATTQAGLRAVIFREVQTMEKHLVSEVMEHAASDIEAWSSAGRDGLLTVGIAPHSPYSCNPEVFRRAGDYARETGRPAAIHLAGSREEYAFVKYGSSRLAVDVRAEYDGRAPGWLPTGVSPVRYVLQWGLFDVPELIAVHCTQVDDEDIEILASHDVAIAHCPRCNAKLAMGLAPLAKFIRSGIRVGIGTDSPAATNSMDMFVEMRTGLLLQRAVLGEDQWVSAREFVHISTLDAARALGMEDRIGSLDPGKQADIIAIDLSHSHQVPTQYPYSTIVHTGNTEDVIFTMVAGRVVYENGSCPTLDTERLFLRADEMRDKLRA